MQTINTEFKELCLKRLGKENGEKVYQFYRLLSPSKQSKVEKKLSLTERRTRSLNYLLDNYSEEALLSTIDMFTKKTASGEIVVNTIPYFNKCVENYKTSKPIRTNPIFNVQKQSSVVIPIRLRLVDNPNFPDEYKNFNYIWFCTECKSEIVGLDMKCPSCLSEINWKGVKHD